MNTEKIQNFKHKFAKVPAPAEFQELLDLDCSVSLRTSIGPDFL